MLLFNPSLEALEDRLCQSTIAGVGGDEPTAMLLPAVQKVRAAAARMSCVQEDFKPGATLDAGGKEQGPFLSVLEGETKGFTPGLVLSFDEGDTSMRKKNNPPPPPPPPPPPRDTIEIMSYSW